MSRRAYYARRAARQHRPRANNGAGIVLGECFACDRRRPLIETTGLCQECTTNEDQQLAPLSLLPSSFPYQQEHAHG